MFESFIAFFEALSRNYKPVDLPENAPTEEALLRLHNAQRNPKYPLKLNPELSKAAQDHAENMHKIRHINHANFVQRVHAVDYQFRRIGENVAAGQKTPHEVMQSWMNSYYHRKNILNRSFVDLGVGRYGDYWCTIFGQPMIINSSIVQS